MAVQVGGCSLHWNRCCRGTVLKVKAPVTSHHKPRFRSMRHLWYVLPLFHTTPFTQTFAFVIKQNLQRTKGSPSPILTFTSSLSPHYIRLYPDYLNKLFLFACLNSNYGCKPLLTTSTLLFPTFTYSPRTPSELRSSALELLSRLPPAQCLLQIISYLRSHYLRLRPIILRERITNSAAPHYKYKK